MKFRHEYKHRINLSDCMVLKGRLSSVMNRDAHADNNGTYLIKSLYFDNYLDTALREKQDGVDKREKFRIRYYGNDTSFIRLEKKSKINGLCLKESANISAEECQRIIDGDISFLESDKRALCRELYAKMQFNLLRPKCIVAYVRESFVCSAGNVRVTIDTSIGGSYDVGGFLMTGTSYIHLLSYSILEVKWDEYLPDFIRDAVQTKSRMSNSFSKYAAVRI